MRDRHGQPGHDIRRQQLARQLAHQGEMAGVDGYVVSGKGAD
jgi:hypothetical protein